MAYQLGVKAHIKGLNHVIRVAPKDEPEYRKAFMRDLESINVVKWEYLTAGRLPAAGELSSPRDASVIYNLSAETRKVDLKFYSLAFGDNYWEAATDQTGILKGVKDDIQYGFYLAREMSAAAIINNRNNTANPVGYDNLTLANSAHTTDTGTFSNISTAALLSHESIASMIASIRSTHKSKSGTVWHQGPMNLIYAPALEDLASRVLNSQYKAGDSNQENPTFIRKLVNATAGNPHFTSTTFYALVPATRSPIVSAMGPNPFYDEQGEYGTANRIKIMQAAWMQTALHPQGIQFNEGL